MWGVPWHWGPGVPEDLLQVLAVFGIFFLPFITIIFIVWLIIRARMRRRQWEHEEKMAMAEKGILPEAQTTEANLPREESSRLDKILLTGIILAALGLMWIFESFGFFLFLLGVGLAALYFIPQGKRISRKGNKKFYTSGIIIAAIGAGVWAHSFGLFLIILGSGLVGFYFLSQRESSVQASAVTPEPEKAEGKQPEQREREDETSESDSSSG